MIKKVIIGLVIALIIAQFFRIDKTNPKTNRDMDFIAFSNPPEHVKNIIETTCYDCHSNAVKYPWYANIAPVSWIIKDHINEGREHLNFSIWNNYSQKKKAHKIEACYEELEEGEMPLKSYTIMHKNARLSDVDRNTLIKWFKDQL